MRPRRSPRGCAPPAEPSWAGFMKEQSGTMKGPPDRTVAEDTRVGEGGWGPSFGLPCTISCRRAQFPSTCVRPCICSSIGRLAMPHHPPSVIHPRRGILWTAPAPIAFHGAAHYQPRPHHLPQQKAPIAPPVSTASWAVSLCPLLHLSLGLLRIATDPSTCSCRSSRQAPWLTPGGQTARTTSRHSPGK